MSWISSRELWESRERELVEIAAEAVQRRSVVLRSVCIAGGKVFTTLNAGPRLDGSPRHAPYKLEWQGPWDSYGQIILDADLRPIWPVSPPRRG